MFKKLHRHHWSAHRRFPATALALAATLCLSMSMTDQASALYILTGVDDAAIVLDKDADVRDFSSRLIYIGRNSGGYEITLTEGQIVVVRHRGAALTIPAREETVSQLLSRLNLEPEPDEMIAVDLSGGTVKLTVADELTYQERMAEVVPYETVRVMDHTLPMGEEVVEQPGADGFGTVVYEVAWANGAQVSREAVAVENSTAVDEVIRCGTAVESVDRSDTLTEVVRDGDGGGYLAFASGATLAFSEARTMTGTAYTTGYDGVGTITATGTRVAVGSIAVDKRVVPLGTRLFVVTSDGSYVYGMGKAEDTGVRGNAVDLFHDTYEQCINFGRRDCTVYLLGE